MIQIEKKDLQNLEDQASLKNKVDELKLQDKLGKKNFHENIKKVFEPFTDTIKNTSENLTKTMKELLLKTAKQFQI